jgi:flagellar FliL protein
LTVGRIVICLFLIFAVSGIGMDRSPFAATAAHAEGKAKKKKGGGGEGGEDPNAPHPDFEYIELKPLILPVITDKGLTQQVSLMVSLELPYGKTEEVEPLEPKLTDAYLQDLYGALGAGTTMMRGGVIDVVALKARLLSVSQKVLGDDKFHDVLLQVVQQRPM